MECYTLIVACLLCLLPLATCVTPSGTTPGIQNIFLGRCLAYQEIIKPYPQTTVDCNSLWVKFTTSFEGKEPCGLTSKDYSDFIETSLSSLPEDKAMFWSGTYRVAHDYAESGKRFITLEDTLLGYIMNGLVWCGQTAPPGINYHSCPSFNGCPVAANTAFWGKASSQFASRARGTVTVLLDGSNPAKPAYRTDSYFARFELPSLSPEEVQMVNIYVVHAVNQPYRETCNNGTLPAMQRAVKEHGLKYTCQDNPQAILHLLCVDSPGSLMCRIAQHGNYSHIFG
ncbi:ADP-ribosyl cyclase/cyclic ADP-ribose hydrolase-like [Mizuhopecten yessoensis]|uniref:ADP-ribosyl cyclase n=1 Tax=Mizuhopecten yessoensis TaxID=6573 RepID=A0A210Q6R8_MIZYE|nr:ADP-ribosyl cyclase/cyclic ADP-ribose hydrolase-like [Mizuhopecten yessoensis]OWF44433.1 ADP-ribosyl cyclase [Mizuhopecten yessoensis]